MKFKATEEQVAQMAANAINASKPMGLGFLSADMGKTYTPQDALKAIDIHAGRGGLYLDYVDGRMVKLNIHHKNGIWEMDDRLFEDYQSWSKTYSSAKALAESVPGVEII